MEEITQAIVARFFEAIDALKADGTLNGESTFCKRYGINRMNFYTQRKDLARGYIKLAWLNFLVVDYGVSAAWLLTGKGKMIKKTAKKLQI